MQQETGELKESEDGTAEFETPTDDEEVTILSQDRSRETYNFSDSDIREEETLSSTQQEDWLLPTESLHGTPPRQTGSSLVDFRKIVYGMAVSVKVILGRR